ncbi:hypothetical protein [Rhizobium sp. G21]|uniref:hypothetical protein n=1 Tax=Rhizobium sp. G21 TaxID=2758439 RepID=UPI001602F730|nr:hypothetical protein [Rhizobium sp. G21]MBB1249137.1 hypothetical protein [Rhizobium sp. G21]
MPSAKDIAVAVLPMQSTPRGRICLIDEVSGDGDTKLLNHGAISFVFAHNDSDDAALRQKETSSTACWSVRMTIKKV